MCGSWDWADNEQERQNNFVHTALLQGRLLDVGAAEQDLLVHLQLRGSALERCGWLAPRPYSCTGWRPRSTGGSAFLCILRNSLFREREEMPGKLQSLVLRIIVHTDIVTVSTWLG